MNGRLIVTADDVGLHPVMTAGAIRAHREGIVTACSVMANGEAFADAVEQLRDVPSLAVGVHLTLVGGRALTSAPRLAPGGWFFAGHGAFLPRYLGRSIGIAEIERELRAQLERVLATGLAVTHLNGHQHLHLLPRVFEIVLRLAQEYRIRYVRIVDDRGGSAGAIRQLSIAALSRLGRRARSKASGVTTNDRTIGVTEAGSLTAPRLVTLLQSATGLTELVCHPGTDDAALARSYCWGYAWERETAALCDPSVRAALQAGGVSLVAP